MPNIQSKLSDIQAELVVPKTKWNSYGGFYYRSCEDILDAVKPIAKERGCIVTLSDSIELVGERYYVKATATIVDMEDGSTAFSTSYAREAESRKGSDVSQVTGAASTYARKYALAGLFAIDDSVDADVPKAAEKTQEGPFNAKCQVCGSWYAFESYEHMMGCE